MKKISIFGAGLVGSLLSVYLAKRGYKVDIYERRPDMRKEKIAAGRSINLALSERGWRGLEGVGLADEIRKIAIPMKGRMIHPQTKNPELIFQPYGKVGQAIYSVSRGGLNMKMMDLAEQNPNVKIHFNQRCVSVDLENCSAKIDDGKSISEIKSDFIFGADGAFSAVRESLMKTDRFEYSQSYIEHAYKELVIPSGTNSQWKMEKNALHIWPRKKFMLIALPNMDGSFTCTLFFPFEGKLSFSSVKNENDLLKFANEYFPDAVPMMPTLKEDFFKNPTSSLVTVRCYPWIYKDKVALIGDAGHAIVPFFGQGMNAGFEDCTVLNGLMNEHGENWEKILKEFQIKRKPNGDAVADLALENFVEMRDKIGDKKFLFRKKIEKMLAERYPEKFIPLYAQVSFSHTPYSEAQRIGKLQDGLLEKIASIQDLEKKWDEREVKNKIENSLQNYFKQIAE